MNMPSASTRFAERAVARGRTLGGFLRVVGVVAVPFIGIVVGDRPTG
jgi:hypothetical protein